MSAPRPGTIGVGILGAGPVVQAIHLPTLSRLTDRFTVTNIMDIAPDIAASVAGRVGASSSTSLEELLADENVEVVVVCSPPQFHAKQVVAAMRAGKRAVLCEKPFATTQQEAEEITAVSRETGVPVIVGAMHSFDPAWTGARAAWAALPETAHSIRSSIVLPPNERFEDWATEVVSRPEGAIPTWWELPGEVQGQIMSSLVLGLAIHDLPLIRTFLGDDQEVTVTSARLLKPLGYAVTVAAGERTLQLLGAFHGHWKPEWALDVVSNDEALHVEFTPSYVHAGSGMATLQNADGNVRRFGHIDHNGYEGEWRALHALVEGNTSVAPSLDAIVADLTLAISIADQSGALLAQEVHV